MVLPEEWVMIGGLAGALVKELFLYRGYIDDMVSLLKVRKGKERVALGELERKMNALDIEWGGIHSTICSVHTRGVSTPIPH